MFFLVFFATCINSEVQNKKLRKKSSVNATYYFLKPTQEVVHSLMHMKFQTRLEKLTVPFPLPALFANLEPVMLTTLTLITR